MGNIRTKVAQTNLTKEKAVISPMIVDSNKKWEIIVCGYIHHQFLFLFTNNEMMPYGITQIIIAYCSLITFEAFDVYPKEKLLDDYTFIKIVGQGSSGVSKVMLVYKEDEDEKQYAIKISKLIKLGFRNICPISKENNHGKKCRYIQNLFNRQIISNIEHPFILSLHCAFLNIKRSKVYMVFNPFVARELFVNHQRMSTEQCIFYSAQIFLALRHLHENNIILCDLSLENIIVCEDNYIRIFDHKLYYESIIKTEISSGENQIIHRCDYYSSSKEYAAPEIVQYLSDKNSNSGCFESDEKFDWWTFGILLYLMLTGETPFNKVLNFDISEEALIDRILHSEIDIEKNVGSYSSACDLLQGLLNRDIEQRYGANDIEKHQFYENIDWNQLYLKKIPCPL